MILTVDIGNTSVTLGGFENNILKFVFRIKSDRNLNVDGCCEQLRNQFKKHNVSFEHLKGCIISSVVPVLTPIVFDSLKQILKQHPFLIEDFSYLPLKVYEYDTSNLGTDRIINCIAALKKFKVKVAKSGVPSKLKEKKCYDKPGVKRRKAKEEMIRNSRKRRRNDR